VAEDADRIIGFVSVLLTRWNPEGKCYWERVAPYLAFVGVLPEWGGKGIGTALLRHAVEQGALRCTHESFMYLEHDLGNPVHRLYERVGFESMTGEQVVAAAGKAYEGRIFMRLDLDSVRHEY